MLRGLESLRPSEGELMHVLSATRWQVFVKVRLPRSLPFLFSALRIVSTTSVIGAIVGEWIGSDVGLGALIIQSAFNYRAPLLYAAIFASSSLALLQFAAVVLLEKWLIRWSG
jgi:NitT/TauT family transport system permease protein